MKNSRDQFPSRITPDDELALPLSGTVEEQELIMRFRQGDTGALEWLHTQYWEVLVTYANRMVGSVEGARDIVQDVFVDLWVHRSTWGLNGTVAAYLYRAVRNRALAVLRDHDTAARLSLYAFTPTAEARGDELIVARELSQIVHDTLHTLGARCREVYLLRAEQGLSVQEVAEVMGITNGTVRLQLARAVAAIRMQVRAYLADSDPSNPHKQI